MVSKIKVVAVLVGALMLAAAAPPSPATAATPADYHVVRLGDTLSGIARMHGLRYLDIARWNGVRPPYLIWEDETLRLTRPSTPLPNFSTRVEIVTPAMVSWDAAKGCPVEPGELRRIWVSYLDFDGEYRDGSIIMHRRNVARTQRVFKRLYYTKFRIQVMAPMTLNAPGITDLAAVTTGWACRTVGGSDVWSQHAYGNAIDLNPVQNPMVEDGRITPSSGAGHLRRGQHLLGMVHAGGAVPTLTSNGFIWGGRWKTLKDYMHFSTTGRQRRPRAARAVPGRCFAPRHVDAGGPGRKAWPRAVAEEPGANPGRSRHCDRGATRDDATAGDGRKAAVSDDPGARRLRPLRHRHAGVDTRRKDTYACLRA